MKTLIRIYTACCLIVVGFFVFFSIPWGLLPFPDAVNVMLVGGVITAAATAILVHLAGGKGFEFGWFLAHGGFWVIVALVFGLLVLVCGTLLFVAPELFLPVFEQGSLPIGMLIVSLFWMALIFAFGFWAFQLLSAAVTPIRAMKLQASLVSLAIGSFCLLLTGVFFSLYLDAINDYLIRISEGYRWNAACLFAGVLAAAAFIHGFLEQRNRPAHRR